MLLTFEYEEVLSTFFADDSDSSSIQRQLAQKPCLQLCLVSQFSTHSTQPVLHAIMAFDLDLKTLFSQTHQSSLDYIFQLLIDLKVTF